jgi:hypothetical protein
MHTAFFNKIFKIKNIHIKSQSLHTTSTNLTMGEDDVNRAMCSEDNKIPPSSRDQEHIVYLEMASRRNESARLV